MPEPEALPKATETRSPARRFLLPAVSIALSITVALLLSEALLWLLDVNPEYQYGEWRLELDRRVLYKIKPSSGPEINSLGFRDKEFPREKGGRTRVLFLGDSFTMGHNVAPEESLPKALERRLGVGYEVFNLGIYGYGPDQSLMRLIEEGFDLDPDAVILGLFPANDFGDLYKNQLYRVTRSGEIEFNTDNPVAQAFPRSRLAMLLRKAVTREHYLERERELAVWQLLLSDTYTLLGKRDEPATAGAIRLMDAVLAQFRRETKRRGLPFGVVIIPSYENTRDVSWFQEKGIPLALRFTNENAVEEICRRRNIPFLNLVGPFLRERERAIYDTGDHHFSVEGNEYAASLLAPFFVNEVMRRE